MSPSETGVSSGVDEEMMSRKREQAAAEEEQSEKAKKYAEGMEAAGMCEKVMGESKGKECQAAW